MCLCLSVFSISLPPPPLPPLSLSHFSLSLSLSFSLCVSLCLSKGCRKAFYHAYIHNKLEYRILLFGGAAAHQLGPLKSLQKRAVKLVVKKSSTNVFKAACALSLQSLIDFQRSLQTMKSTNNKIPQYTKALFTLCPNGNNRFRLPLPRLDIYKSHSLYFSAVMSWNSLPINPRSSMKSISLNNLKRKLGNYLLSKV